MRPNGQGFMWREAATQSRVEPSRPHYSHIWSLRQVANRGAVPIVGLMEVSLHQRARYRTAVVVIPSYKTGHKRQIQVGDELILTTRIRIRKPCD